VRSRVIEVQEIDNPRLRAVYEAYKAAISTADDVVNGNELLCFHGCTRAHSKSPCSLAIHLPFV